MRLQVTNALERLSKPRTICLLGAALCPDCQLGVGNCRALDEQSLSGLDAPGMPGTFNIKISGSLFACF